MLKLKIIYLFYHFYSMFIYFLFCDKENKEQNLLSASLNQNTNQDDNQFIEKTVYRSSKKCKI